MRRATIITALTSIAVLGLVVVGCGGSPTATGLGSARPGRPAASLVLDFTPNPVHVGIYTALARRDDVAAGIRLHVIVPSASTDAVRLLQAGRADFAILDIHDLALARARGASIVGILPLVQRPLAAVIAAPGVGSPRALDGRTVGVSGAPSDTAVLDSVVAGAGGRPSSLHPVTIGFDAVSDLLAGRVAAATAFWNDEGVTLARRHPGPHGFHVFRVDDYGAPSYPELVVCATLSFLTRHAALAAGLHRALTAGYDTALADPAAGRRALESQVPGLDPALVAAQLAALRPAFTGPGGHFGVFDLARLRAWARWEARFGIVRRPPGVAAMFDTALSRPAR